MAEPASYLDALGRAVRALRGVKRTSQLQLALDSGVHRNYVGGIERGERQPSVTAIVELAAGLGVMPSEIFRMAERILESQPPFADPQP
jgi:transcriptional regulator with XRE-family HTH domain